MEANTNPNVVAPATAPADEELPPIVICPILTAGAETFDKELPELLKTHRGQWVAYHGTRRLAIGTYRDVYRASMKFNIPEWELLILGIEEEPEEYHIYTPGLI